MIRSGLKRRAAAIKAGGKRKTRSKAAKLHMSRVAGLGCVACRLGGYAGSPAELHHPRTNAGAGQKSPDNDVIPLCHAHHRGTMHPAIPSIHLDRLKFIAQFGTEADLLAMVRCELGIEGDA